MTRRPAGFFLDGYSTSIDYVAVAVCIGVVMLGILGKIGLF